MQITDPVLAVWEYLITFADEVELCWRKPISMTSLLLVVTRWTMLANAVLTFVPVTAITLYSMPLPHMLDTNIFPVTATP